MAIETVLTAPALRSLHLKLGSLADEVAGPDEELRVQTSVAGYWSAHDQSIGSVLRGDKCRVFAE